MYKLVLVHPNPKYQRLYRKAFSPYFDISAAYDGLQALRVIQNFIPDLVLSEFSLPELSGLSVLNFVRRSKQFAQVPFIFISLKQPDTDSLNLGATDWLTTSSMDTDKLIERCFKHLKNYKLKTLTK